MPRGNSLKPTKTQIVEVIEQTASHAQTAVENMQKYAPSAVQAIQSAQDVADTFQALVNYFNEEDVKEQAEFLDKFLSRTRSGYVGAYSAIEDKLADIERRKAEAIAAIEAEALAELEGIDSEAA